MNKSSLRKLIKEELMKELNEEEKNLYKFIFKSKYLNDNEKPQVPIYVYLTPKEKKIFSSYIAIDKILNLGKIDYQTLPARKKLNTMFVKSPNKLKYILKGLHMVKIWRENNIIKEGLTRKDIDLIRSIIRQELADIYKTFWIKRNIWK